MIETAREGLVSSEFARNTAPDWLIAAQDGIPVALRDTLLFATVADDAPEAPCAGVAMILRTYRRLRFDPTRAWQFKAQAVWEHGILQPEIGSVHLSLTHVTPERFFTRSGHLERLLPWRGALFNRQGDLAVAGAFTAILLIVQGRAACLVSPRCATIRARALPCWR